MSNTKLSCSAGPIFLGSKKKYIGLASADFNGSDSLRCRLPIGPSHLCKSVYRPLTSSSNFFASSSFTRSIRICFQTREFSNLPLSPSVDSQDSVVSLVVTQFVRLTLVRSMRCDLEFTRLMFRNEKFPHSSCQTFLQILDAHSATGAIRIRRSSNPASSETLGACNVSLHSGQFRSSTCVCSSVVSVYYGVA